MAANCEGLAQLGAESVLNSLASFLLLSSTMRARHSVAGLITALLSAIGGANGCGGTSETRTDDVTGITRDVLCTPRAANWLGQGFALCGEGYMHRPRIQACGPPLTELVRPPGTCDPSLILASNTVTCLTDADCTERAGGRCNYEPGSPSSSGGCSCSYPCASDADCDGGFLCFCDGLPDADTGRCIPATCKSDADCNGKLCGMAEITCPKFFACFSERDTCRAFEDCSPSESCQLDHRGGSRSCVPLSHECQGG